MRRTLVLATAAFSLAACTHKDSSPDTASAMGGEGDSVAATVAATGRIVQRAAARAGVVAGAPVSGPGATVIRTTDGEVTLSLAHDTVSMGLSDSVLAVARQEMAKDTTQHGLAGAFSGFIKKTVASALHSRVTYPVQDLESAKYENGRIVFAYRQKRQMAFEDVGQDKKKALASFAPADAQRFVAAVDSAIAATRGR
jgi:hypothetical protein